MFARIPASLLCSSLVSGAVLVALIGLGTSTAATAQDRAAAAAPAKQVSVAQQKPTAKEASAKREKPSAKQAKRSPRESKGKPEPEMVVAAADEQQILAAKEVHLGESSCEFGQKISLDSSKKHPGYVDLSFNKRLYTMKPVMSSTGALRLEDVRNETLMIQIASKTMLMNQKTGQRLVDNCVHDKQKTVTADTTPVLMK